MAENNVEVKKKIVSFNQNDPAKTIRLELNRDAEVDKLLAERDIYKEKLVERAAIDFSKQCQKYGLDPATATPDDLNAKKEESKFYPSPPPKGGDTSPLNPPTDDHTVSFSSEEEIPMSWMKFESESDFYQKLSERSRKNDREAKEIEQELVRKAFSKPFLLEFAGDSTKVLYKDYLPVGDNLPIEERQRRIAYNKKLREQKSNWRVIQ